MVLIIAGAMAFAIFQPITVLPRMRLAPGFGVTDQSGQLFTSETTRGTVTLYSFSSLDCDDRCLELADTLSDVEERIAADPNLDEVDVRLVTIALDADATPEQLRSAADASGADGETWRWVGGSETQIENLVGVGFKRYFEYQSDGSIAYDGGFVIVDGWGVVRGDYKYQTLSDDADKLARHLGLLGAEIRYASGAGALAYEAAHLFLCYP
ncbi:MAG: SCO family protein [Acidimicrobiales bacterium]